MGRTGSRVVNGLLMFTQFGFCCVYVVFCAKATHQYVNLSWKLLVLVWYPVFVLLSWVRTLKILGYVSLLANIVTVFSLIVIYMASLVVIFGFVFSFFSFFLNIYKIHYFILFYFILFYFILFNFYFLFKFMLCYFISRLTFIFFVHSGEEMMKKALLKK